MRSRPTTARPPAPRSRRWPAGAMPSTPPSPPRSPWAWSARSPPVSEEAASLWSTRPGTRRSTRSISARARRRRSTSKLWSDGTSRGRGRARPPMRRGRARPLIAKKIPRHAASASASRESRPGSSGCRSTSPSARWPRMAAPAAALAEKGFVLGRNLSEQLAMPFVREEMAASPELANLFLSGRSTAGVRRDGEATGARADHRAVRRRGIEAVLHHGAIAQEIAKAVQAAGGTLTEKDLADYKVQMRTPLMREIDGKQVYTMGAPSAGGLMLLETLEMYGASPSSALAKNRFGSSATLHLLAEAMRGAVADRVRYATDPSVQKTVEALYDTALEPKQIEARKKRIDPRKTTQAPELRSREHGTSHLIIADEEGNVVSMTTTGERSDGRAHRRRRLGGHPQQRARRLLRVAGHRRLRPGRSRPQSSAPARPAGVEHDAGDRPRARRADPRRGRKRRRAHRHRRHPGGRREADLRARPGRRRLRAAHPREHRTGSLLRRRPGRRRGRRPQVARRATEGRRQRPPGGADGRLGDALGRSQGLRPPAIRARWDRPPRSERDQRSKLAATRHALSSPDSQRGTSWRRSSATTSRCGPSPRAASSRC